MKNEAKAYLDISIRTVVGISAAYRYVERFFSVKRTIEKEARVREKGAKIWEIKYIG